MLWQNVSMVSLIPRKMMSIETVGISIDLVKELQILSFIGQRIKSCQRNFFAFPKLSISIRIQVVSVGTTRLMSKSKKTVRPNHTETFSPFLSYAFCSDNSFNMKYIPVASSILQASCYASQVSVNSKTSGKTLRLYGLCKIWL